jgi:hypothetical protein
VISYGPSGRNRRLHLGKIYALAVALAYLRMRRFHWEFNSPASDICRRFRQPKLSPQHAPIRWAVKLRGVR